jgi:hypothetical protein
MTIKKVIKYAKNHHFDILFLGGNRFRYNHFGFENAGRRLVFNISQRTKQVLKSEEYKVVKLDKNNNADINAGLSLYNKQLIHSQRTSANFYEHTISWGCQPYVIKVDDRVVGYFLRKEQRDIFELVFENKYLDTVLMACLGDNDEVSIALPYSLYSEKLLSKVEAYSVCHCEMFNVLNWDSVSKYLNFPSDYQNDFNKLTKKEKIRYGLGFDEFSSKIADFDMFIYPCDQG